jgi:5-methylcytosine-specific restriction endonuclease McrA
MHKRVRVLTESELVKRRVASAQWRLENPGKDREYHKNYYRKNRENCKLASETWKQEHPEKEKEYGRRRYKEHPEESKAAYHKRRARILGNGGFFTAEEWVALCSRYGNRCLCCGRKRKLTADHVVPITKGGTSNIDNIQPLCKSCNSRKNNRTIDYRKLNLRIQ